MYLRQLMFSEIRRHSKKRRLQFKVLMRYLAVSIAFLTPIILLSDMVDSKHCVKATFSALQ